MTKTPEEIIDEAWANGEIVCGWDVRTALDQSGWAIVPKKPTGAQRQLFGEMVKAGDGFAEIYPAVLNEWAP